jgi:hypothetical protein
MVLWLVSNELENIYKEAVIVSSMYFCAFAWSDCGNPRETSVRTAGVPLEIQTEHSTNTSQQRYSYTKLSVTLIRYNEKTAIRLESTRSYSSMLRLKTVQSEKICDGVLVDKEKCHISVATLLVARTWLKNLTASPSTISHTFPISVFRLDYRDISIRVL